MKKKRTSSTKRVVRQRRNELQKHRPVLFSSRPAAGFPAPGDDQVEEQLDLNRLMVAHPASTFFVRVDGDSMVGAGILSDDILVVDRAREARHGSIVVAAVYGELVVKRLSLKQGVMSLVSENPSYTPIVLGDRSDCHIWGVVTGVVRTMN